MQTNLMCIACAVIFHLFMNTQARIFGFKHREVQRVLLFSQINTFQYLTSFNLWGTDGFSSLVIVFPEDKLVLKFVKIHELFILSEALC